MSGAEEREARSVALEKAYVHEVYEQISATQFPGDGPRGRAWPKVKQFLSELEPGSLVCDVGCGNGKYLNVNPSVFKVGADRCRTLTEVAREKEHEVLMCDNLSLPFRDESFDAVLSVAVVHHFATTERRVGALRELARVLRIGGRLIISVWAMEQRHRKFESQDVLVPWHRPQHLSTPSLELTSTTTTTSEDDGPPPYHAYTQTSDSDSCRSARPGAGQRKRGRSRHKGRSIDPARPTSGSQSSSSLSSPNETCYSFVRRALQKLAGGKRGGSGHRPWFLDSWSSCTKEPPPHRYDPEGCEEGENDGEDIHDLPIELRRLEDEQHEPPQRRQTFACTRRATPHEVILNHKSKSLSDILTVGQRAMVRSRSSVPSLGGPSGSESKPSGMDSTPNSNGNSNKPRLVKQKKSVCEEEMEEDGDEPTDMRDLVKALPEFKVSGHGGARRYGNVFKQSSMNEELMSTERLREKERVRQNIQKQASLNEELIYRRHRTLDSLRDTLFSTSTAKRFQLLKNGLTNKLKSSTTGIEKVAGTSFKNGFVRILQGWKGSEVTPMAKPPPTPTSAEGLSPRTPPPDSKRPPNCSMDDKKDSTKPGERRHSREDGSDSSKDSSLQSDTSVDSEDSFASVIFVPKPDQQQGGADVVTTNTTTLTTPSGSVTSPGLPSQLSPPKSPQPTSPKVKLQSPLLPPLLPPPPAPVEPLPPPPPPSLPPAEDVEEDSELAAEIKHNERLRQIQEMLRARALPGTSRLPSGPARSAFPLVRRSSAMVLARPLPRLLSLELFNPETDDMDSDSSGVSSPDSVSSVISVLTEEPTLTLQHISDVPISEASLPTITPAPVPPPAPKTPEIVATSTEDLVLDLTDTEEDRAAAEQPRVSPSSLSLLEAAADVASTLEDAVDAVIQSSPRARRRKLQLLESTDPLALIQGGYNSSLHRSESIGKFSSPGISPVTDRRSSRSWSQQASADSSRKLSPRRDVEEKTEAHESWDESCRQHLADFAEKLSEKLLEEIDQYRRQTCQPQSLPVSRNKFTGLPEGYEHIDDPYLSRLSEELEDLTKLSEELQKRNSFIASLNEAPQIISPKSQIISRDTLDREFVKDTSVTLIFDKVDEHPEIDTNPSLTSEAVISESKLSSGPLSSDTIPERDNACETYSRQTSADITEDLETCLEEPEPDLELETADDDEDDQQPLTVVENLEVTTTSAAAAPAHDASTSSAPASDASTSSAIEGDSEKPKSSENVPTLRTGYSIESSDAGDTASGSDCSRNKTASTASLGPNSMESSDAGSDCSRDVRYADRRTARCDGRSSSEEAPVPPRPMLARQEPPEMLTKTESCASSLSGSTSQESLPSDNGGGAITFHRYYHVFREGELDQLIERYVENLHIISSYYDHANWCVVAEKVQVWTI
ncbi:uncharacterized protein [Anabrus simplex]|uniref:uncharacterized protein n=1 Tax=Anabrus simplex TaxID=316456 RepID=UPI0035A34BB7